jgi:hypothetical protein
MPDRHDRHNDDVDSWLSGRIDPLPPPPGTFELIKRRARRRKYRRLAITAGAAAVIVAAGITVPQVVSLSPLGPVNASGRNAPGPSPGGTATGTGGGGPLASSAASAQPTVPPPVPPNFQPTSVTFVSTSIGWVIGQAGTPGHCATRYCTSVARTDNAGKTWFGVPAPLTGAPSGATGVGGIRFLNGIDGWAFGPQLFATHDRGHTWTQVNTDGLRVTDLETVGDRAFAVFASCTGSGSAFAAQCTTFTLYSSPAGADDWTPVGASTSGLTTGTAGSASIVLTGSTGYLLGPGGMLYSGPVDGSAAWSQVARVPCAVGTAQPDGLPSGALLGAIDASNLIIACLQQAGMPGGQQQKVIYSSANGGASWQQVATAPTAGVASSVAASPSQAVILGTNEGIDVLASGGTSWQQATLLSGSPRASGAAGASGAPGAPVAVAGGFQYVGMTTDEQGIALPADATDGVVWFTFDGGAHWQPSPVSSPEVSGS